MADLKFTAGDFRETLTAANPNRVIRHPIAQSKNDLKELQTDNLTLTCTCMDKNLRPLSSKEIL